MRDAQKKVFLKASDENVKRAQMLEKSVDKLIVENTKQEKSSIKPHCWGKMDWILKYPNGEEPKSSICNCEHGASKCKDLTRENAPKN